jgi:hypothetical protein
LTVVLVPAGMVWQTSLPAADRRGDPHAVAVGREQVEQLSAEKIRQLVDQHLASRPGYRDGFIISRSDVKPLLDRFRAAGWDPAALARIEQSLLADDHFLVRQLRTREGRRFMQEASEFPLVYDRMEKVSKQKGGARAIRSTVVLPNGASFWNAEAKPGFNNTVQMLPTKNGRRRSGQEFSQPTGKIYTASQFAQHLEQARPKPQKQPSKSGGRRGDRSVSR